VACRCSSALQLTVRENASLLGTVRATEASSRSGGTDGATSSGTVLVGDAFAAAAAAEIGDGGLALWVWVATG